MFSNISFLPAPWYVDIYDAKAPFGSGKSCGYDVVLKDWYHSYGGLVVRPFFMIELNASEINKSIGRQKFEIEKRRHYAIPQDVLQKLATHEGTRSLIDHGLQFIDALCSWKSCMSTNQKLSTDSAKSF